MKKQQYNVVADTYVVKEDNTLIRLNKLEEGDLIRNSQGLLSEVVSVTKKKTEPIYEINDEFNSLVVHGNTHLKIKRNNKIYYSMVKDLKLNDEIIHSFNKTIPLCQLNDTLTVNDLKIIIDERFVLLLGQVFKYSNRTSNQLEIIIKDYQFRNNILSWLEDEEYDYYYNWDESEDFNNQEIIIKDKKLLSILDALFVFKNGEPTTLPDFLYYSSTPTILVKFLTSLTGNYKSYFTSRILLNKLQALMILHSMPYSIKDSIFTGYNNINLENVDYYSTKIQQLKLINLEYISVLKLNTDVGILTSFGQLKPE